MMDRIESTAREPIMLSSDDRRCVISGVSVRFDDAHWVFLNEDRCRYLRNLELCTLQRNRCEALQALIDLQNALGSFRAAIWKLSIEGYLSVRSKRRNSALFDSIPADQLRETWPDGPLFPHEKYEWVEVCGTVPPWINITVGNSEPIIPEFVYADDYSLVSIRNLTFELGAAQAGIVRVLHEASLKPNCTMTEGAIREIIGFSGSLPDLFKRHQNWPELIEKVGRARYRLNLRSERSWMYFADARERPVRNRSGARPAKILHTPVRRNRSESHGTASYADGSQGTLGHK